MGLARFLKEQEGEIERALHDDMGRPAFEAYPSEIALIACRAGAGPEEAADMDQAPAGLDGDGLPARP